MSDYVRLWALYNWGGVYLDTDAEILKDISHLLDNDAFLAFECSDMVNTGVMGCCKDDKILKEMLIFYESLHFDKNAPIVTGRFITKVLEKYGLELNGKLQKVGNWIIYPFEYFYPVKLINSNTYYTQDTCICHWWEGTWWPEEYKIARRHNKNIFIIVLRKIGIIKIYHKLFRKKK